MFRLGCNAGQYPDANRTLLFTEPTWPDVVLAHGSEKTVAINSVDGKAVKEQQGDQDDGADGKQHGESAGT